LQSTDKKSQVLIDLAHEHHTSSTQFSPDKQSSTVVDGTLVHLRNGPQSKTEGSSLYLHQSSVVSTGGE